MSKAFKPENIDLVIHERVRLAIVSTLAVVPQMSFNELRESLSLTDGNLSTHARTLEEAGYIRIEKSVRGRKPLTRMSLTKKGRKAFREYIALLEKIVESNRLIGGKDAGKHGGKGSGKKK